MMRHDTTLIEDAIDVVMLVSRTVPSVRDGLTVTLFSDASAWPAHAVDVVIGETRDGERLARVYIMDDNGNPASLYAERTITPTTHLETVANLALEALTHAARTPKD
jgi:hypothetical protein